MTQLSRNLSRFKLVTFDITDTLLKFSLEPEAQYAKTAHKLGYPNVDQNKLRENFRTQFKIMLKKYPNFGKTSNEIDWKKWWQTLVINIFRASESTIDDRGLRMIADSLIVEYESKECWMKIEKSDELINKIKGSGKKVGVISNFDPRLKIIVDEIDLPKFDFILTSYEVGREKPSPEIFQLALQHCEPADVKSSEALHVGNTAYLDYLGAINAGWSGVLINSVDYVESKVNHKHKFKSLAEFLTALETNEIEW